MTIYYVDKSSKFASDRNPGTSAAAPLTSLEAVNKLKLQAGDTVAFKAGTAYTASAAGTGALNITASGTEKAPITFTTYGTGPAATIANSAAGYSDAINVANAKYVVIDGLTITGAAQAGVNVTKSASHITIRNVEASQVGEGVMLNGTDNLVTRSYFHDLKMIKNTANVYDDDYGAVGVMIGNSNNEVSYTRIVNAKAPSFDYGHDGGGIELFGTMNNVKIHDNWIENTVGFIEAGGYKNSLTNISITNNVSLNNNGFLVLHNGGGNFASTFRNVDLSHNTIVEQKNTAKSLASVFLDAAYKAGQLSFHDSIIYLNAGDSFFKQSGAYHSNNVFYKLSSATHLYNDWGMTLGSGEKFATLASAGTSSIVQALAAQASGAGSTLVAATQTGPAFAASHAVTGTMPTSASTQIATPASTLEPALKQAAAPAPIPSEPARTERALVDGDRVMSTYDASGKLASKVVQHADTSYDVYVDGLAGKAYASAHTRYDGTGKIVLQEQFRDDGSLMMRKISGTDITTETYDAGGAAIRTVVQHPDKTSDVYLAGLTGKDHVAEHARYAANGKIGFVDRTKPDGSHVQTAYQADQTLVSTPGVSDILKSAGGDTFVFASGFGQDTITGFHAGAGSGHDILRLDKAQVSSFAALQDHMTDAGADTLLTLGAHDTILLKGVEKALLTAENVHIQDHGLLHA
ncbi:hypothetical protein ASF49_04690 [Methylobacterium sp. Leaf104]|nr:hypothetical protein ASF49_04690 [Methylobacterium sp. Leaf104]